MEPSPRIEIPSAKPDGEGNNNGVFKDKKMKRIIHVNQHIIKRNHKTGERVPPLTCKTYKDNVKCTELIINKHTKVIYRPDKPLPCGAKVWIETTEEVECVRNK